MATGDIWAENHPCPNRNCSGTVTVRETRKGTGHVRCSSCSGTHFYNVSRAQFAQAHGLPAPSSSGGQEPTPAPKKKKPRKAAAKKSPPTHQEGQHGHEEEEPKRAGGLGEVFGF